MIQIAKDKLRQLILANIAMNLCGTVHSRQGIS
jgi:hypothetical protein